MTNQSELQIAAVDAIYDAASAPDNWPLALEKIAQCFHATGAVLMQHRRDKRFPTRVSPSMVKAAIAYHNHWWQHDLRAQRGFELGFLTPDGVFTDRHMMDPDEIAGTRPFYTEYEAKHGLGWAMGACIEPLPKTLVTLSVHRPLGKDTEFTDDELKSLAHLARHCEKSLRLTVRLLENEVSHLALGEALARLGCGVFLLDDTGHVVFANKAAEVLVGDGLCVNNRLLDAELSADREALKATIHAMTSGQRQDLSTYPKPVLVHRRDHDKPLVIYVLPVKSIGQRLIDDVPTSTRAIVIVQQQESQEPADPTLVRDLLGLTLGEARVAALVGSGLPPREAAEKLGIAASTARFVLQRVFEKVGVSRQSELVALLGRLRLLGSKA